MKTNGRGLDVYFKRIKVNKFLLKMVVAIICFCTFVRFFIEKVN